MYFSEDQVKDKMNNQESEVRGNSNRCFGSLGSAFYTVTWGSSLECTEIEITFYIQKSNYLLLHRPLMLNLRI